MTHNAGFENPTTIDEELSRPDEIWETRQVMLAQGKEIKSLKEIVKDLDARINGLTKRYDTHLHFKSDSSYYTSYPREDE
jgi:hypothetical protein